MDLERIKYLAGILMEAPMPAGNGLGHRWLPHRYPDGYDLKGTADVKQRLVNNTGDNPFYDVVDESVDEECGDSGQVEALRQMLKTAGVSDEQMAQVQLTDAGKAKVQRTLGVEDVDSLLRQLGGQNEPVDPGLQNDYMKTVGQPQMVTMGEDEDLEEADPFNGDGGVMAQQGEPQDDRFAYESDFMGNVTVRDSKSGRSILLQGSHGAQLLKQLEDAEPDQHKVQQILQRYEHRMPPPQDFGQVESVQEDDDYHKRKEERRKKYRQTHGKKWVTCSACSGSGRYDAKGSPPCAACDGRGKVPARESGMNESFGGDEFESNFDTKITDYEGENFIPVRVFYAYTTPYRGGRWEPSEGSSSGIIRVVNKATGEEIPWDQIHPDDQSDLRGQLDKEIEQQGEE